MPEQPSGKHRKELDCWNLVLFAYLPLLAVMLNDYFHGACSASALLSANVLLLAFMCLVGKYLGHRID